MQCRRRIQVVRQAKGDLGAKYAAAKLPIATAGK